MIETKRPVRILGFAGSLRQGSYNRALLRAASELAPEDMLIEIFDLLQIPLYSADVEARGDPEPVAAFKQAIRQADAVLMVTPEYNHGVPGVMKNAVDWASRPARSAVLNAKPVAIIGASPGVTGTARGQSQLRQAFEFTNSYAIAEGLRRTAVFGVLPRFRAAVLRLVLIGLPLAWERLLIAFPRARTRHRSGSN
jgi:chromate reductase, NAD(P)H dehydrogenase (quinone)